MTGTRSRLVLASSSRTRRQLLEAAGIAVTIDPAAVDEEALKMSARRNGAGATDCAGILAAAKADPVSHRYPHTLVIGADQMLDCDGTWLDKPRDAAEARRHLSLLRGRTHSLHSAVAVMQDGAALWHCAETAQLAMRDFSDAFLDDYLAAMGERVYATVGGYEIEGLGAQLFARIDGDYFVILGLPLLPLLDFLRRHGALAA
jgi:nucleoside triphosphate pyrophosphatase